MPFSCCWDPQSPSRRRHTRVSKAGVQDRAWARDPVHPGLCHLLSWPHTLCLTSLNLSFLICKMRMITSASRGTWEINELWDVKVFDAETNMTSFPFIVCIFHGTEPYFRQKAYCGRVSTVWFVDYFKAGLMRKCQPSTCCQHRTV